MAPADLHAKYLVEAVSAALHHKPIPKPDFPFDPELFLRLVSDQHLSTLLYPAFKSSEGILPDEAAEKLRRDCRLDQQRAAEQEDALEELTEAFSAQKIRFLALKGIVLKRYYDKPSYRMMGDLDLLIEPENRARARDIMESLGYRTASYGEMYDDVYFRRPFLEVELHVALGRPEDYSDERFATLWDRAAFSPEKPCFGELSPVDYYLYFLLHAAKHFRGRGTGVRTVIDLWCLKERFLPALDRAQLDIELEKFGMLTFERELTALCEAWFDRGEAEGFFGEPMLRFLILDGGLYGNEENAFFKHTVEDGDVSQAHANKRKLFLRRIFPTRENMAVRYPVLDKHPWLLPFFWFWRILRTLVRPDKVQGEARLYRKVSDGMDLQTELRERFGLLPENNSGEDRG